MKFNADFVGITYVVLFLVIYYHLCFAAIMPNAIDKNKSSVISKLRSSQLTVSSSKRVGRRLIVVRRRYPPFIIPYYNFECYPPLPPPPPLPPFVCFPPLC
jgi:hypothetical protein